MFHPIYREAFVRGTAPDALDRTPLHVLRWAVTDPPTPADDLEYGGDQPESVADLVAEHRRREAAAG